MRDPWRSPSARRLSLLLAFPFLVQCASLQTRTLHTPDDPRRPLPQSAPGGASGPRADQLKVHLKDGRLLRLDQWSFTDSTGRISGFGDLMDLNRDLLRSGVLSASLDSVALLEANSAVLSPSVAALTVVTVASVGFTLYCLANPKACFGSCPTFYASDGTSDRLMAEGFSASVAPILEATDLDALALARPHGDSLTLHLTNEALETHVIRYADLLVAPRPAGGRVFATGDRRFLRATEPMSATRILDPTGADPELFQSHDARERFSLADSAQLDAKEEIFFEYPAGSGSGADLGLVVACRQSLLTTFLFYQTLAYLGNSAGDWLARLERGDSGLAERIAEPGRLLGGIVVAVERDGAWIDVGEIRETGPLATDLRLVPLPPVEGDTVRVRLRLTRGAWRLDWVGLTHLLGPVEPQRVAPARVTCEGLPAETALASLRDRHEPLVTLPGDEYDLSYRLPPCSGEREVFLESRGYYLEWMRPQWIEEESPVLAARMVLDPARSLRELAPRYKAMEPEMERIFWSSRYARH